MARRKYDSRRRSEQGEQTRQTIVEMAVRMHGQGITTLSAIAEEAGVSLPTLNKYFPTRDDLFMACSNHLAAQLEYPSTEALLEIDDPGARLERIVQEVFRLHEETNGQMWTGYKLEDESSVLARALQEYEAVIETLAEAIPYEHADDDQDIVVRFVRAALSPLTFRALRFKNGLSLEDAVRNMTLALAGVLNIEV